MSISQWKCNCLSHKENRLGYQILPLKMIIHKHNILHVNHWVVKWQLKKELWRWQRIASSISYLFTTGVKYHIQQKFWRGITSVTVGNQRLSQEDGWFLLDDSYLLWYKITVTVHWSITFPTEEDRYSEDKRKTEYLAFSTYTYTYTHIHTHRHTHV